MNYQKYSEKNIDIPLPQDKIFRIYFDDVTKKFRILCRKEVLTAIISTFTDTNTSAFFSNQFGYNVPMTISPINDFGYFPQGMIFEILKYIKLNYGTLNVVAMSKECKSYIDEVLTPFKSFAASVKFEDFEPDNIADDSGLNEELRKNGKPEYKFRDYQRDAIKHLILTGKGRGMVELPTASGKSNIIANLIYTIHKRIDNTYKYLIYVPNRQLVDQMYKDMLDYGYTKTQITRFTSGLKKNDAFDKNAQIIVANRQFIDKNLDLLPKIDVLINDEVHQSKNSKSKTFSFIDNLDCKIKFGLTATLPREKINLWNLQGVFGRVVFKKAIVDLQKSGYISKLKIDVITIKDLVVDADRNYLFHLNPNKRYNKENPDDIMFDQAYRDEIEYINKNYSELYTPILKQLERYDGNMLILFDRIEFGKNMFELAKEMKIRNSNFFYIDGTINVKDREKVRAEFEASGNNILFAQSTTFSTGISIKRLTNLVLFFSGKGFSKILQSVGRTLRLHKTKDYAQLIDINFNFKYSHKHYLERRAIYRTSYAKNDPDNEYLIEI